MEQLRRSSGIDVRRRQSVERLVPARAEFPVLRTHTVDERGGHTGRQTRAGNVFSLRKRG